MKSLIYLIFTTIPLFSASITLNEARDQNSDFSILHIKDKDQFSCKVKMSDNFKNIILCKFPQPITPPIYNKDRDIQIVSNNNILEITPKYKFKLVGLQDAFITDSIVHTTNRNKYKHWIVTAYKKDIEMFDKFDKSGIDFDLTFTENFYPYVEILNIDGLPIVEKSDAVVLNRIKERFEEKQYEQVITLVDQLLSNENMFSEEANLYKLRALDKLIWNNKRNTNADDKSKLIEGAQEWIKQQPSSKYIPEVLMYLAKTYYKLGYNKKADEYAQILYNEFFDNKYNHIAQIYKADRVYENRKRRVEAIKIYEEVLYNTKDLDIASRVAIKLSNVYMTKGDTENAYKYYKKVIDANKAYIVRNKEESYQIAKKFAEQERYDVAIKIVANLIDGKNTSEGMLKDLAYWYDLNQNKNAAYGLYKQYLKDFPQGQYTGFVESRIDRLIVDMDETNITKKLKNLDDIMMKYPNDSVYKKALLEKARTYVKNKEFKKLFEIKDALEANDGRDILRSAAKKMVENDLKDDRCKSAIYMSQEYNVTIVENSQKKFFECLSRLGKYKQALAISKSYINHEELSTKLYWLYQTLKVHSKLGNSKKVLLLSEDIEKLSDLLKVDKYNDIAYNKVEAYFDLRINNGLMLQEVIKIEKLFPNDIKNVDLFLKVVRYAKKNKNDTTIAIYAKKIIDLQKRHKLSDYSPLIELDYINALKRLKQYNKALKEDLKLLYVKLTDKQKANVLYVAGELSLKLDKSTEAKEFFTKCGEIVDDSAWQGLCAESLKLLEE